MREQFLGASIIVAALFLAGCGTREIYECRGPDGSRVTLMATREQQVFGPAKYVPPTVVQVEDAQGNRWLIDMTSSDPQDWGASYARAGGESSAVTITHTADIMLPGVTVIPRGAPATMPADESEDDDADSMKDNEHTSASGPPAGQSDQPGDDREDK